jgi:hypothetical protein
MHDCNDKRYLSKKDIAARLRKEIKRQANEIFIDFTKNPSKTSTRLISKGCYYDIEININMKNLYNSKNNI